VIPGERGSGVIGVNGACARLSGIGHKLIVMSFCMVTDAEFAAHRPRVVIVGAGNRVAQVTEYAAE
jgi:aspartate 1-decarboxylase